MGWIWQSWIFRNSFSADSGSDFWQPFCFRWSTHLLSDAFNLAHLFSVFLVFMGTERNSSAAGPVWQNNEYSHLDTSALFSCFLLGPALNFSIIWDGWFFLFDFEVKVLVRLMCFHTARPLPQQLAVYLSVTLVKYLFWLWYFLLTMKQNKKYTPEIPQPRNLISGKRKKKKKPFLTG